MSLEREEKFETDEVLLMPNPHRHVLYPIHFPKIWDYYLTHVAGFWTFDEIDLTKDYKDWQNLSSDEQHFIKMVLAFFAASDGIVMENLAQRFMSEVQIPEARAFYAIQIAMETIHAQTYSELIDTYIKNEEERKKLFGAVDNFPSIQAKANWALKYINSSDSFATRLAAFAMVEGVFFSGSFCAIYWLKKRGKMPGLTFSNELISRDEGLHTDFACLLFNMLKQKPTVDEIHQMIKEAVEIEIAFVKEALPVGLIGMNESLMSTYIQFIADRLLSVMNVPKVWNVRNPFEWMEMISLSGKTNFFEKRVGEYKRRTVQEQQQSTDITSDMVGFECDFDE